MKIEIDTTKKVSALTTEQLIEQLKRWTVVKTQPPCPPTWDVPGMSTTVCVLNELDACIDLYRLEGEKGVYIGQILFD